MMLVYRRRDHALLPDGWRILDKTVEGVFRCEALAGTPLGRLRNCTGATLLKVVGNGSA
jgi:hypothetical protein